MITHHLTDLTDLTHTADLPALCLPGENNKMEEPKHDLPTLHRPVTRDIVDSNVELRRELNPLPTPPHKSPRHITMIRPQ